jgi:hypothetical protein
VWPPSKAFKNRGTSSDAVASDPACKNVRRLICMDGLFKMFQNPFDEVDGSLVSDSLQQPISSR